MTPTQDQLIQAAAIINQIGKTTEQIIYEVAEIIAARDDYKQIINSETPQFIS